MKYKNNSLSLYFLKKLVLSNRSASLIRRITLISFFTITLSITVFFIILFVMNGMNRNIKIRIMALEPHLTTIHKPSENTEVIKTLGGTYASYIEYQNLDLILKTIDGQFRGGAAVGYSTVGLNTWSKQVVNLKNQTHQKSYEDFDTELKLDLNEVAIGIDLARSLGVLEGDEVTLIPPETLLLSSLEAPTLQKVTVRKIISTSLQDLNTKLILFNSELSLINFKSTLSFQSGFHVWFKNVDDADSIVKSLQIKSIASSTWKEKNSDLFFALKLEKLMIGIFLGLAGLIASSSILTVLALLMSQKKRDIAIIKTLGLSENKTLWVFTKIGLWISGTAIILGSVLGIGISLYIEYNPVNILPHIYYDALVPSFVDFYFAGWVFLVSVLLAFLGSYFPAKATLKIQPALLLKQKN